MKQAQLSLADILALQISERIRLVQAIWDSIAEAPELLPVTGPQRDELDRRLAAYEEDPEAGSTWSDVKARIIGQR